MTALLTTAHVRPYRLIVTGKRDAAFDAFTVALSRMREPPAITDHPAPWDGRDRNHPCMTEMDDGR